MHTFTNTYTPERMFTQTHTLTKTHEHIPNHTRIRTHTNHIRTHIHTNTHIHIKPHLHTNTENVLRAHAVDQAPGISCTIPYSQFSINKSYMTWSLQLYLKLRTSQMLIFKKISIWAKKQQNGLQWAEVKGNANQKKEETR
jgi:hypothetical protein